MNHSNNIVIVPEKAFLRLHLQLHKYSNKITYSPTISKGQYLLQREWICRWGVEYLLKNICVIYFLNITYFSFWTRFFFVSCYVTGCAIRLQNCLHTYKSHTFTDFVHVCKSNYSQILIRVFRSHCTFSDSDFLSLCILKCRVWEKKLQR